MEKTNLLIPIGGQGVRFKEVGFTEPKPLIYVGGKQIIDWSMDSIDLEQFNTTFIVRQDDCRSHKLDKVLKKKFPGCKVIKFEGNTRGAIDTCLFARDLIDNDTPVAVFTLDVFFQPKYNSRVLPSSVDGRILTFSSTSTNYSYSSIDWETGLVDEVAEKKVISANASAGVYWFKSGKLFLEAADIYMETKGIGELHVAPIYNILIAQQHNIDIQPVHSIYIMGTPKEKDFIESILVDTTLPVGIMCDHSGWESKNTFIEILNKAGIKYIDYGSYTADQCDYPDFVAPTVEAIENKEICYGFGFCRTGQGINIAANAYPHIWGALVYDEYTAQFAVQHNAANFFSIPESANSILTLTQILYAIMGSTFLGGRHQMRLMKI